MLWKKSLLVKKKLLTTILPLFCLGLGVATANAAPKWFVERASTGYGTTPIESASNYLSHNAQRLGIERWGVEHFASFKWRDRRVVRFHVTHKGTPLFGSEIKVMVTPSGAVQVAVLDVPERFEGSAASPSIGEREALEVVENHWLQRGVSVSLGRAHAKLGYRVWGSKGTLCYKILVQVGVKGFLHYVDATTGKILRVHSTAFDSLGRVYEYNPVATPDTIDATLSNLDNETGPDNVLEGWGGDLQVFNHISGTVNDWANIEYGHLAFGDTNGDFLYDATDLHPTFSEPFTEVNLYYNLDKAYTYFLDTHGLSLDRTLYGLANYSENAEPYENAFFTPVSLSEVVIALGQGQDVDYGYDGDVILHEFGHYVVDTVAGLGYLDSYFDEWGRSQMPGGLHEGFADYWSSTQSDDSLMGEYALGAHARDMVNDLVCPDDMFGEPHIDGEVAGGAVWEVHTIAGAENADQLVFGALSLLTPNATFKDLAEGIMVTSQTLVNDGLMTAAEATDIETALSDRGMTKCGRFLEFSQTENPTCFMVGFDMFAAQMGGTCSQVRQYLPYFIPGPFQYRLKTPSSVEGLEYTITMEQQSASPGDDLLYKLYVREGERIHYRMEVLFGGYFEISVPDEFDFETEEFTGFNGQIVLSPETTPELKPDTDYYFAIGYQNCPNTSGTISVTVDDYTPPEPDAGVQEDAEIVEVDASEDATQTGGVNDGGCSCRTSQSSTPRLPLSILFLLALGLWMARRRR